MRWHSADLALFGLDVSDQETVRARSAEVLDVVLKLWDSDGEFEYKGEFFDIKAPSFNTETERGLHMKPYQQPHPPIAVAASTPTSGSMEMAGERGYIPMSSSLLAPTLLASHWEMVERGAERSGAAPRRASWRVARDVYVGPTAEIARERARAVLGRNYIDHQLASRRGTWQMQAMKIDPAMADDAIDVDYLMEEVWIVGDAKECAEKIRDLYATCGGFGRFLAITTDADDPSWDHEHLSLLRQEVAPQLADLSG